MTAPLDPNRRRDDIVFIVPPREPVNDPGARRAAIGGLGLLLIWFCWILFRVAQAWLDGRFPT